MSGAAINRERIAVASAPYTWSGAAVTDTIDVTRAPNTTPDTLNVKSDLNAPTGSISYANGPYASHSVNVTTSASDGESGVAGTQVQRAEAPLTGSTCGTWSAFAPITLNGSGNDTTVTDNTCYQYQLVVTDHVGNSYTATSASVAQIPDITPPTFASAATNAAGTQLTVTMSEPLDNSATTPASAFTVAYNGVVQPTATGISVSGSTVTLNLASPPNNSEIVTIRYSQPSSSGDRMRDNASPTKNETANFGPVAVANNTPDTVAPHITSASANAATISLVFDDTLAGAAPDVNSVHGHDRHEDSLDQCGHDGRQGGHTDDLSRCHEQRQRRRRLRRPGAERAARRDRQQHAPFTFSAANQTPIVAPPAGAGGAGIVSSAPFLVSSSPDDGSTVRQVATITLTADQSVSWTHMTVTAPDGSVSPLSDGAGQSATWPFPTSAAGLYVIRGTLAAGGQTQDVLSHFTVWAPPATGAREPSPRGEERSAVRGQRGAERRRHDDSDLAPRRIQRRGRGPYRTKARKRHAVAPERRARCRGDGVPPQHACPGH